MRIIRVIAQHDSIKNADKLTLNTQLWELGKKDNKDRCTLIGSCINFLWN